MRLKPPVPPLTMPPVDAGPLAEARKGRREEDAERKEVEAKIEFVKARRADKKVEVGATWIQKAQDFASKKAASGAAAAAPEESSSSSTGAPSNPNDLFRHVSGEQLPKSPGRTLVDSALGPDRCPRTEEDGLPMSSPSVASYLQAIFHGPKRPRLRCTEECNYCQLRCMRPRGHEGYCDCGCSAHLSLQAEKLVRLDAPKRGAAASLPLEVVAAAGICFRPLR